MTLTADQITAVELRVSNEKKSSAIAYLLFVFIGGFGTHCFYLGKWGRGTVELFSTIFALAALFAGYPGPTALFLAFNGIMFLWDLFSIPRYTRQHSEAVRNRTVSRYFPNAVNT
ncbi:NINE protein [Methylosinus sp. R-45379]|uniref:NINE protein n=1 Tax=Methylosinus sp. R-45379 TaxID=980563 RepID=UPI0012EEAAC9|nr:TM2 domain-containing protein [Methylosinus sp. R-45379]